MTIKIALYRPDCQCAKINKNGKKTCQKQNDQMAISALIPIENHIFC
jgi:hypothetical protein